ncbi:MAG: MBL fold metallo-hydrolase [Bacillota bacterium]|nr:MBL fold metallo-hydrolase [Bacillota bacterium]
MVEKVAKNIYKIDVPLKGNPLKSLNAYFLRGDEEDFLIDTGFNTKDCEDTLRAGLEELNYRPDKLSILNTHLHADHTGLDYVFTGKDKKAYLSKPDYDSIIKFYFGPGFGREARDLVEGITPELFSKMRNSTPSKIYRPAHYDLDHLTYFEDGAVFHCGDLELKAVMVPGHTVGNTMFWCEKEKIMFTGDHILFDITPNISIWMEIEDALSHYLDSLNKADAFDVQLALPSHRKTGDYHARIASLKEHHEKRLKSILDIIEKEPGLNAYEITQRMSWKIHLNEDGSFPLTQLYFATGEAMAHLDCLITRGLIEKKMEEPYYVYYLA